MRPLILFVTILFLQANGLIAAPVHWNQFRGPNGAGVVESFRPPLELDASKPVWKTMLPPGHSSPVLWGDRMFVTAVDGKQLVTFGINARTGAVLWKKNAPDVLLEKVHPAGSPAASSPCADEHRVYVYFGSFGLLCYDHDGNEIWRKPIPTPQSLYGMSTSPILHQNLLVLVLDNDANLPDSKLSRSKVIALNRETGELVWETPRPFNRSSWSTPMIWEHKNGSVLAVIGNGRAYAYEPMTGEEKWYVNGFSRETIAVPVAGEELLYFSATRQGGSGDSQIDPEPFWEAILAFDLNRDQRVGRDEITEHFTIPFRPELLPGHPGFGYPLPKDPAKRRERQERLFDSRDRNNDGYWTKEEFTKDMTVGRGRPNLSAVEPGGNGDVTRSRVAWTLRTGIPEIPSPVFYDGRLYLIRSGGVLSCINGADADLIYRERLGAMGQYTASPVMASGHFYFVSTRGVVTIVRTGDAFEVVHQMDLGEPVPATPAIDHDSLYIRTKTGMVAFR